MEWLVSEWLVADLVGVAGLVRGRSGLVGVSGLVGLERVDWLQWSVCSERPVWSEWPVCSEWPVWFEWLVWSVSSVRSGWCGLFGVAGVV